MTKSTREIVEVTLSGVAMIQCDLRSRSTIVMVVLIIMRPALEMLGRVVVPSPRRMVNTWARTWLLNSTLAGTQTHLHSSNMDSDKPVYPSNPTLVDAANRYVGDGKMFKVDNLDPSNAAIATVNVTNADGEALTSNSVIKVGDEVRVAIAVDGDVLFRESGMRAQIQAQDAKGSYNGVLISSLTPPPGRGVADLTAPVTRTTNFSAAQVITASNDSLRASWNIGEGFFTYKTDDFVDIIGSKRYGV